MGLHDFIFSDDRPLRFARHLCFWLGWALFSISAQATNVPFNSNVNLLEFQALKTANRLVPQLVFCYVVVYVLVSRFIPSQRYGQFITSFLLFTVTFYLFTNAWFYFTVNILRIHGHNGWLFFSRVFNSFYTIVNFTGALPTCCFILAIKYYKDWYLKQRLSEQLKQENRQAELQLLKAQIHPHFLFNTLNNIYSFALTGSQLAACLVDQLSGMIEYIRTEGQKPLVTLQKELRLIEDYIGLEKVRYGKRLNIQVNVHGEVENKYIAPLLMIPFVENCFKHGASVMRGQPWVQLMVIIRDAQLDFRLSNSKPAQPVQHHGKGGLGLVNVRKRLELLYPGTHLLEIKQSENVFDVHLQVQLQQELFTPNKNPVLPTKTVSYA